MRKNPSKRGRVIAAVATFGAISVLSCGLTTASAAAEQNRPSALCNAVATGTAIKWGPVYRSCSYTSPAHGWNGKLTINWAAQQGLACVEAREGNDKHPQKWQSLSCGLHGQGTIKWPKNTASNVEIRVKSEQTPTVNVAYSI